MENPIVLAFLATLGTWGITAVGSAGVFLFKTVKQEILDACLGFAAGVMIAASYWSLLAPSIELSRTLNIIRWVPALVGFLAGGVFLLLVDKLLPHVHLFAERTSAEGIKTDWHKTVLLFIAITLHNFPEGLAIGVAFGAASLGVPGATMAGAIALAIGIGIQNFPEGFAVSVPFRRLGVGRLRSFFYGQASALVEPIAAVLGVIGVILLRPLLPYALAFAAGAMIFVTVEEIIPESQHHSPDIATIGTMLGFVTMMVLDVALT